MYIKRWGIKKASMVKTRSDVLTLMMMMTFICSFRNKNEVCRSEVCASKSGVEGETKRTIGGRDGDSGKFKRAKMAVTRILYSSSSGFIRLEEAFACLPVCPIELHTNARAKASSVHARHTHTFSGLMSSVGVWSCVYLRLRAG